MKYSFETDTKLESKKIWGFYEDIKKWFLWEDDLEEITLDGEFITGTTGTMTLTGMPTMSFTLTKVIPNQLFVDKTVVEDMGELYFIHELIEKENLTTVRHSVEFIAFNGQDLLDYTKFVGQVFSDVPASIFKLIESAYEEI